MITSVVATVSGSFGARITAWSDRADAVFHWFLSGREYGTTGVVRSSGASYAGEIEIHTPGDVAVDVFDQDEPDGRPEAGGADIRVAWEHAPGTVEYLVQHREAGGEWATVETFEGVDGTGLYRCVLRSLADETVHEVQILAVDAAGTQSVVYTESGLLVRTPDVPPQSVELVQVLEDDIVVGSVLSVGGGG